MSEDVPPWPVVSTRKPPDRVVIFIDAQNLYHGVKDAWASNPAPSGSPFIYPSFDVQKLCNHIVARKAGRAIEEIRFYTGVPDRTGGTQTFWHDFWNNKLRALKNQINDVHIYRGRINPGGQEKGVDVSIAIDLVQLTHEMKFEVAIIVSQDADFGPAVKLSKRIAKEQTRTLTYESIFASGPGTKYDRGVPGTAWDTIDEKTYLRLIDTKDYRPPKLPGA